MRCCRGRRRSITVASFVAALVSVPAAAVAFTLIYAIGGTTDVPIGKVFTAMVGVHVLIGIGEALITALTVGAVIAVRPDLVHGARGLTAPLKLRGRRRARRRAGHASPPPSPPGPHAQGLDHRPGHRPRPRGFVSFYASASPDGLEKVAADQGIDEKAEHARRPRTPRSPTTASRTSPTPGSPAASPA